MAVKYVDEFSFPNSDRTQVRGYFRGGRGMAKGGKVEKTMHEFKEGSLHSGSKKGPLVENRKQAVAIALSQQRKADGMATGGIVSPPKAGIREPRPASGLKAQKMAETLAVRPARGPRIGARIGVSKPPRAPAPSSAPVGALQTASTPLISPQAAPMPGGMKKGGRLTAKTRNAEPKSDFGLPGSRKYPMPDKNHARVAKSYASKEEARGQLSPSAKARIDAKANKILGK